MPEPLEVRLGHECFPQPDNRAARVWRYLSLPKFISLLKHRHLYLSRLDLLKDPHEGAIPKPLIDARREFFGSQGRPDVEAMMRNTNVRARSACYVNSWTQMDAESEALWRQYCQNEEGVAIQSSYERLIDVVAGDDDLYLGQVRYIDYQSESWETGGTINIFSPVMHKRRAFAHEAEIRLVKVLYAHVPENAPRGPAGVTVPVVLEELVEGMFVSPYAQEWYFDVVKAVVQEFGRSLVERVGWSLMKGEPFY